MTDRPGPAPGDMVSDLPPEDTDRVQIGSRVEVFFDDLAGTKVTLPRVRLT